MRTHAVRVGFRYDRRVRRHNVPFKTDLKCYQNTQKYEDFFKLSSLETYELLQYCADLSLAWTVESESDIETVYHSNELINIQHFTKIHHCNIPYCCTKCNKKKINIGFISMDFVENYIDHAGVTVASGEKSISKLMLIKI